MPVDLRHREAWGEAAAAARLGGLSARYESGGRGPGTVSTGQGDPGGVSYGTYQMATNRGTPQDFMARQGSAWPELAGRTPGTPAFGAAWQDAARRDPEGFGAAQHAYIKATHFDPQAALIRKQTGTDVSARSPALQDVVWSTAVQHGGGTQIVVRAIRKVAAEGGSLRSDADLIRAIYAERGRKGPDGRLRQFPKASAKVQAAVAARYAREERDALAMLRNGPGLR